MDQSQRSGLWSPRRTAMAITAAALSAGALAGCATGDGEQRPREITTVGVGEASGTPDVLTVEMAVQHDAADVTSALSDASASAQAVLDAATSGGVEAADVQTTNVRVDPTYGPDAGVIVSYQATQSMTINIRNLDTASELLGALAAAGGDATRINSVGFDLDNDDALAATARDAAFAQARQRAEQYASLSGGTLGEVRTVTEAPVQVQQPERDFSTFGDAAPASIPLAPGEQSLTVSVTVVFELA